MLKNKNKIMQTGFSKVAILIIVLIILSGVLARQALEDRREKQQIASEITVFNIGSSTIDERIVDETANWQIYRNEEYGFEIKYPADLKQFEWPSAIFTLVTSDYEVEKNDGAMSGATLKGAKLKLEISALLKEDFVTRRCEYLKIGSPNLECIQLTFFDFPASEVTDKVNEQVREKSFFVEKGEKVYIFSVDVSSPIEKHQDFFNIFNQILSTFKFID